MMQHEYISGSNNWLRPQQYSQMHHPVQIHVANKGSISMPFNKIANPNVQPSRRSVFFPQNLIPSCVNLPQSVKETTEVQRVLCYGDSLTAGLAGNFVTKYSPYAARLSELLGCRVDHVGLSGWTTTQMVNILHKSSAVDVKDRRWDNAGMAYALRQAREEGKPYTCVIIMAGTNDLYDTKTADIVRNLMILHQTARAFGAVSVAVGVPKHGALVCKKWEDAMGASSARNLRRNIDDLNTALKAAVMRANEHDENGGSITFVDVHSEVLRSVAESSKADLFAGFPTLAEYKSFMMQSVMSQPGAERAMRTLDQKFSCYSAEEMSRKINQTHEVERIRMTMPNHYAMLEDSLHFSPAGYRAFAETLHSLVADHISNKRKPKQNNANADISRRSSSSTISSAGSFR